MADEVEGIDDSGGGDWMSGFADVLTGTAEVFGQVNTMLGKKPATTAKKTTAKTQPWYMQPTTWMIAAGVGVAVVVILRMRK